MLWENFDSEVKATIVGWAAFFVLLWSWSAIIGATFTLKDFHWWYMPTIISAVVTTIAAPVALAIYAGDYFQAQLWASRNKE